jgi:hypothetical protein
VGDFTDAGARPGVDPAHLDSVPGNPANYFVGAFVAGDFDAAETVVEQADDF